MDGLKQDTAFIRELVRYSGVTATEVAKKAKVAPSTINRPYSGTAETRLSQRTIEKLYDAFPKFPGWTRAGAAAITGLVEADPVEDSLPIPMLELAYGLGGTFLDDAGGGERIEHFPRAFVRMFTNAPADQLVFSHGIGDSMEPTIGDRDLLLIDRSRDAIRINDQIWVLATGGIGMVKRVRIERGETRLLSDNTNVPDYIAAEDELQIIGRVVAIVRRL